MTEENKPQEKKEQKKKIEAKPLPVDKEKAKEIEEKMHQEKAEKETKEEAKSETKAEEKKKEKTAVKKEEAVARGVSLPISKKHSMYICSFIKHKKIDNAIADLEQVIKMKRAVPFKGEIPHRKEQGIMSGRYPVTAAGYFINLLKGLKGNVIVNGLDLENTTICLASASWASRPMRSGGRLAKRTNILLKAKEIKEAKK